MPVELRTPVPDDDAMVCALRNHFRFNFFDTRLITLPQHRAFVARTLADPTARLWSIYHNGCHVGQCGLVEITSEQAEFGRFMLMPTACGAGVAVQAELLALRYAFDELHVLSVVCRTRTCNDPVLRLHERMGFVLEEQAAGVTTQRLWMTTFYAQTQHLERLFDAASRGDRSVLPGVTTARGVG